MTGSDRTGCRFAGRRALVTGAAGDIGRAVAVRLAREGADVVVSGLDRAAEAIAATVAACEQVGSGVASALPFDVTDEQAVDAAVAELADRGEAPAVVVASAGVQGAFAHTTEQHADDVRAVLEVNVTGTFTVVRAVAEALIAADRPGAFVTLASMAGVSGAPNMVGYAASKAAVLGLTRAAAMDLAPHDIRVNAVSPAFIGPGAMWDRQVARQASVPSPYFADTPGEVATQMLGSVPMRRYGSLDEVAAVVAFLASDDASYVTGTNTEISGGGG